MSLHVELSEEAKKRVERERRFSAISSVAISFFVIALIVLSLIAITLNVVLIEDAPVLVTQRTEQVDKPEVKPETPKQVSRQKPSAPSSVMVRVIASDSDSPLSIPVSDVDVETPTVEFGDGNDFGNGDNFGKDWGGEGGEGGIKLFGKDLNVKSIGVVLDVSRSMTPHLGRVLDEIDRLAPGSPVMLHFGCGVGSNGSSDKIIAHDAPRNRFKEMWYLVQHKDYGDMTSKPEKAKIDLSKELPSPEVYGKLANRPETFFYVWEGKASTGNAIMSRQFRKVEAIYWFADFQDKIEPDEAEDVLRKLKRRKQKLFIHSTGTGPYLDIARDTIAIPSGGDQLLEPVGK